MAKISQYTSSLHGGTESSSSITIDQRFNEKSPDTKENLRLKWALEHSLQIPPRFRGSFLKVANRTASYRKAIEAKCYECCGYEDVRIRVEQCLCVRCPLWAYRPRQ